MSFEHKMLLAVKELFKLILHINLSQWSLKKNKSVLRGDSPRRVIVVVSCRLNMYLSSGHFKAE